MSAVIIAECCQNHNGSIEVLKRMIHEAAEAGATYVKIQAARSRELSYRERFEEGQQDHEGHTEVIKRPYAPEFDRLSKLDLTPDDEAWFVDECRRAGIRSMITPFTRGSVRDIEDMGFDAVKVASYDCKSLPLLRDLTERWSVLFVSTGATLDSEVQAAARVLKGSTFSFLHCVTIYPTPLHELHLQRLSYLQRFTPSVGFSDHTHYGQHGTKASKIALALGADVIEHHFTVLEPDETRDGPVSIDKKGLAELVRFSNLDRTEQMQIVSREVPEWEDSLGSARRPLSHEEWLNRDYYAGRFMTRVGDRTFANWEDVDLDALRNASGISRAHDLSS